MDVLCQAVTDMSVYAYVIHLSLSASGCCRHNPVASKVKEEAGDWGAICERYHLEWRMSSEVTAEVPPCLPPSNQEQYLPSRKIPWNECQEIRDWSPTLPVHCSVLPSAVPFEDLETALPSLQPLTTLSHK